MEIPWWSFPTWVDVMGLDICSCVVVFILLDCVCVHNSVRSAIHDSVKYSIAYYLFVCCCCFLLLFFI